MVIKIMYEKIFAQHANNERCKVGTICIIFTNAEWVIE